MELRTTGITGLDAQYGGGFPAGAFVLLVAEPMNALSLFLDQFVQGGLEKGEQVHYVAIERRPEDVQESVKQLMGKPAEPLALQIQDFAGLQFEGMNGDAAKRYKFPTTGNVLEALSKFLSSEVNQPCRLAVESITELLGHYPEKDVLKAVRLMKLFANHNQALTVATVTKGLHPEPLLTELKHMADGVMEFAVERKGFGIYNYIIISKMKGISDATRLLLFKETDKGLWLESTRRVF